jgi:excisionase family DNA binding protein
MDDERTATIEAHPEMLTLMEVAAILRIGRTTAYQLAAEYLRTGGTRGLPVVRVGRQFRVLRSDLDDVMKNGTTRSAPRSHSARRRRSEPRSEATTGQSRLFG